MAKAKYERWLTKEGKTLLGGWARDGLTDEEIAKKMGVSRSTLNDWKNHHPDISDTIKKGKEVVDYAVESALLKKALAGDVGACCFWLKNRRPDKWKDRIDSMVTMETPKPEMLDDIRAEMARLKAADPP